MKNRLDQKFADLRAANQSAFIPFITAGDPSQALSLEILKGLPRVGADIIELGMPFSDPSADGPTIDRSSGRALAAGASMLKTLDLVRLFRQENQETPIVLMGYFNPLLAYGLKQFTVDAVEAGADGLIIVDLPPEEDAELRIPALKAGLHLVRLATPTSDEKRLASIVNTASGFIYYVAVAGITGQKTADDGDIEKAIARLKKATDLPVAVGFGIKTPEKAAAVARVADATVVGSAIVDLIEQGVAQDHEPADIKNRVLTFVEALANGVHSAQR